jgi:hypothetical protein
MHLQLSGLIYYYPLSKATLISFEKLIRRGNSIWATTVYILLFQMHIAFTKFSGI